MEPLLRREGSLRATYDHDAKALYIYLPGHPATPGSVEQTRTEIDGLHYDMADGKDIGIEVLLDSPLEVMGGENGTTRTAVRYPAGFRIDWDDPSMDAYNDA